MLAVQASTGPKTESKEKRTYRTVAASLLVARTLPGARKDATFEAPGLTRSKLGAKGIATRNRKSEGLNDKRKGESSEQKAMHGLRCI